MELLRSSIIGKEFVNYRKTTLKDQRNYFSHNVRVQGLGNVPIVVDSVDKELSTALSEKHGFRNVTYGREFVFHMDCFLSDVLKEVKIYLIEKDLERIVKSNNLILGLENGDLPDLNTKIGDLYKQHRNQEDKILYLLLTKETSVYNYLISLLKFLGDSIAQLFYKTN